MSEIEKIKRYIERTKPDYDGRYRMNINEAFELFHAARQEDNAIYEMICLAFDYGRAKGYRAAKAGAKQGARGAAGGVA